jgi:hypothetical protein
MALSFVYLAFVRVVCLLWATDKTRHPGVTCEPEDPFPTLLLSISHIVANATSSGEVVVSTIG